MPKNHKEVEPVMFESKSVEVEIKAERFVKFYNTRTGETKIVRAVDDMAKLRVEKGLDDRWITK